MDYRYCPLEELRHEITRRGFVAYGGRDELSERLCHDDALRGTDATTIATTVARECEQPRSRYQIANYDGINPSLLVGECIIHWKLNTLFSTLQLFFESGLSCTIESRQLREAFVGIDQSLRFRLTDLTYEEDGVIVKSPLPKKVVGPYPSIQILEAVIADRLSIVTKPTATVGIRHMASIEYEAHTVVGLKLEGMSEIGYVWSKVDQVSGDRNGVAWGNTSVGSLRDDIPAPLFNLFSRRTGKSGQQEVTRKQNIMTRARAWSDPAPLLPVRDPEDHICELGQCFPDMA